MSSVIAERQTMLDRALYLAEAGFHVIPLGGYGQRPPDYFINDRHNGNLDAATAAWCKSPRISWRQYQTAPATEETIRHWFSMWPDANIGIATGKLVAVDADCAESVAWVRANLTYTPWRVKTGKGEHSYYRENPAIEVRNSADPLAKLDTRGMGGYVVAGGSRHSNGNYYTDDIDPSIGAAALCDLPMLQQSDIDAMKAYRHSNLQAANPEQPRGGAGNLNGFNAGSYAPKADGSPVAEGGRNDAAASWVGTLINRGYSVPEIMAQMLVWNETNRPPLSATELVTTVASVVATHNRNNPNQKVPIEPQPKSETTEPVDLDAHLVNLDDPADLDAPEPHYIDKLIPAGEVTLLAGHGGSGKSYVALVMAICVALGVSFAGLATTQASVLFYSCEDGKSILLKRVARICRAMKVDVADLKGKLHLLDASDLDPALHREQRVGGRQSIELETRMLGLLADQVKRHDVGLVIVDNASDAYDDNEIVRARVRTFIRSLRTRIARPNRAVLLLAHVSKVSAVMGKSAGSEDYSGSTAWNNSVRSRLGLFADGANLILQPLKANYGPMGDEIRLVWLDGVPLPAGTVPTAGADAAKAIREAAQATQDKTEMGAIVALIKDFDRRGQPVTAATMGPATMFKLLKNERMFPKGVAKDRFDRLVRDAEDAGLIYRRDVKNAERKLRPVFTCAPEPEPAPAPMPVEKVADADREATAEQDAECAIRA